MLYATGRLTTFGAAALLDLKLFTWGDGYQHTSNTGIILSQYNTKLFLVQGIHKLNFSINKYTILNRT
jgi:hypothetical protein